MRIKNITFHDRTHTVSTVSTVSRRGNFAVVGEGVIMCQKIGPPRVHVSSAG